MLFQGGEGVAGININISIFLHSGIVKYGQLRP